MDRVGLRELRQDLARHVRRASKGKRVLVTDRGRPVAVLAPLPDKESALERLIAEGRATRPKGDLLDLSSQRVEPPADDPYAVSKALEEDRADREL
jgi:prevent-host-death family protein